MCDKVFGPQESVANSQLPPLVDERKFTISHQLFKFMHTIVQGVGRPVVETKIVFDRFFAFPNDNAYICLSPDATASSMTCWIIGLAPTRSISLGMRWEIGRILVPN